MFIYHVAKKDIGLNLKELLLSFKLAKNKINYFIDSKLIMINDEIVNNREYLIKENDTLYIDDKDFEGINYHPVRYNLDILYEDDYILVVNKPENIIIYSDDNDEITMANYIAYYYEKTGQNHSIRHVHRLDRETRGILIYAKDVISHAYLSSLFENHQIKKSYYALVEGRIEKDGIINKAISRNRHNNSMIVNEKGLPALTIYHVLQKFKKNTLLDVEIKTGRTHQIRVHMASINHPLVGDMLYGAKSDGEMMLICHHIGFFNKMVNKWMNLDLPKKY